MLPPLLDGLQRRQPGHLASHPVRPTNHLSLAHLPYQLRSCYKQVWRHDRPGGNVNCQGQKFIYVGVAVGFIVNGEKWTANRGSDEGDMWQQ